MKKHERNLAGIFSKETFWHTVRYSNAGSSWYGIFPFLFVTGRSGSRSMYDDEPRHFDEIRDDFWKLQALLNVILLVIVVIFGGKNLGFGTLANMILIGYYADFFMWIWNQVFPENLFQSMQVRIGVLIPAIIVFILSAALYMDVDMGTAPYDAIPIIISDHLPKVPFKVVRMCFDCIVTILGLVFGGKLGIMTVIMVLTLGPVIQWMGNILKKYFPVLTGEA